MQSFILWLCVLLLVFILCLFVVVFCLLLVVLCLLCHTVSFPLVPFRGLTKVQPAGFNVGESLCFRRAVEDAGEEAAGVLRA